MNFTDFEINEFLPLKNQWIFENLKLMSFTVDQKSQINEFDWEKILK